MYCKSVNILYDNKELQGRLCSGVVEWLARQTSNLRIASHMGSNPVRDKPLFPSARNYKFTLIA